MGYRTTWGIFSASECGAPHQRKRVFILANNQRQRVEELSRWIANGSKEYTAGDYGCNAWPSRPNELADTECGGFIAGRNNAGQSQGSESEHCSAWPSRPGEQQYGWEPPRVVGNARGEESHRLPSGAGRQEMAEARQSGEELGDTESSRAHGAAAPMAGEEHQEEGGEPQARDIGQAAWNDGDGAAEEIRQTQPPLGGDADGSSGRMDYAELCVTCDNRTDELRLLGNGVVPATAERAFRTLIKELDDSENSR